MGPPTFSLPRGFSQIGNLPRFRGMLAAHDGSVVGVRGRQLIRLSPPRYDSASVLGQLPLTRRQLVCWSRLATRALRQTPYQLLRTQRGTYLTMTADGILRKPSQSKLFESVFQDFRGRRPMSICEDASGELYFGDTSAIPIGTQSESLALGMTG